MRRQSNHDHLASSLTDLMTSLLVIFILLLLVFLNKTAGVNAVVTDALLKKLRLELQPQGFSRDNIQPDKRDRYSILVIVPDNLMNFKTGEYELRPEGEQFLKSRIPKLADVLCAEEYRASVDSVIVEGHTDTAPYVGNTREESENRNLKLSQDRSMEVVKKTLQYLTEYSSQRGCLLQKLSASGRGEQDPEATPEQSRRVIFKIRVKADGAEPIEKKITK
jgi:flagellar motor protein MotB